MEHPDQFLSSKTLSGDNARRNIPATRLAHEREAAQLPLQFTTPLTQPRPRSEPPERRDIFHPSVTKSSPFYPSNLSVNEFQLYLRQRNNAPMGESWACPSLTEGLSVDDEVLPEWRSITSSSVNNASEVGNDRVSAPDTAHVPPTTSVNAHSVSEPAEKLSNVSYTLFMDGPAPWSVLDHKKPGTMCTLCGTTFTGLGHQTDARRHIQDAHASLKNNLKLGPRSWKPSPPQNSHQSGHRDDGKKHDLKTEGDISTAGNPPICLPIRVKSPNSAAEGSRLYNLSVHESKHPERLKTSVAMPALSHRPIWDTLPSILDRLDPRIHPDQVNNFFNGLDHVVGDLRERFPNDVLIAGIEKVFEKLERQYILRHEGHSSDQYFPKSGQWTLVHCPTTSVPATNEASSYTASPAGTSLSVTANNASVHPTSGSGVPGAEKSTPNRNRNAVDTRGRRNENKNKRLLACPVKKHSAGNHQHPMCSFEGACNMWGVTQHLRTRVHRQFLPFLALCRICRAYTISETEYRNIHRNGLCPRTPQPRGTKVAGHWLDLYCKIYPYTDRIPSPYVDDPTWTTIHLDHDAEPSFCDDLLDSSDGQSFLDLNSIAQHDNAPYDSSLWVFNQRAIEQDVQAAAMEIIAQTFPTEQRTDLNDLSMERLMNQVNRIRPEDVEEFSNRFLARAYELLHSIQRYADPIPHPAIEPFMPNTHFQSPARETSLLPASNWSAQVPTTGMAAYALNGDFTASVEIPFQQHVQEPTEHWEDQFTIPQIGSLLSLDEPYSLKDPLPLSLQSEMSEADAPGSTPFT